MVQINAGTPQRHPQRRQGEVNDAMNPNSNQKTENPSKHITLVAGRCNFILPAGARCILRPLQEAAPHVPCLPGKAGFRLGCASEKIMK